MSILDIGSNVNSHRNRSFTKLYGSDWPLDLSSATICPPRLDGLSVTGSAACEINGLRIGTLNAIGIAAVILNHTARPVLGGLSGSPPRVSCQKAVFRRKTRQKNSRLGISPNRLWFAARRVTRCDAQEISLTLLGSASAPQLCWHGGGGPFGIPVPTRVSPKQSICSELFPTSEVHMGSLFVSDSSCFDSSF